MAKNFIQKTKKETHKIALYIRVSTEEQAENPEGSIRNQEERLRATINLKNMEAPFGEIVEVFIDRARSGKDTNRPELQRMLSSIRRKEINLVMVSELSRLSRSIKDFSEIWEMMRASECGFHSLRENFDTTTAAGEMVLYTVANIAQFERRQVSERVSANFQARAARGLYNGGVIPLGYKFMPDKSGHLTVDEESAETIPAAFKAFLRQETLSRAAKWLNANGYRMKRETEGGNLRPRLGHFTVYNLHHILCNKSYLGIRRYYVKGMLKETKAVWPALIDEDTFNRVQKLLRENHCRKKPESENRWPFQLTGLVYCAACGHRMVGKSAHGSAGKIPYYDHSWAMKKQACLPKPIHKCNPFRIQAKKLEPAVWEIVSGYLRDPKTAQELIQSANKIHQTQSRSSETKKLQEKIRSFENQLEVLSEQLGLLPKTVSPAPVFKQMEKIEALKAEENLRLEVIQRSEGSSEMPVPLKTYQSFLTNLKDLGDAAKGKVIKALVQRIEIKKDGFKLHLSVGQDYVEKELANQAGSSGSDSSFLKKFSSNSLQNGGR